MFQLLFVMDEYQSCKGNLSHNHLILAINKSTRNGESEKFIQDLIRTSVMEIVKTDTDVPRLIENGLLKSIKDVKEITSLANTILVHKCNERCKIRIRPGNTEKKILDTERYILFMETLTPENTVMFQLKQNIRKQLWKF